jgi:hypothetical protein
MAELPKYRPLGVSIPSIPDVDFVSAGRAQGDVYRSIGKSLDKMVKYAYDKKVASTKREAAKYAFENPVTAEQIQDAISQGRDIEEIVGDPDTIFGAVTTATAAQQLTTELEIAANKKIAQYSAAIESGGLYSNEQITEMRRDLTSMIDAHSEIISGVDVNQALKYNAAANTSASTVYKSALEMQLSVKRAAKVAASDEFLASVPDRLRDILTAKDVDVEKAIGDMAILARQANDVVISTGDLAYAKSKSTEIQTMIRNVQVGVLTDYVIGLPGAKQTSALRSGNMGALTPVYALLDSKEQAEFRSNVRTEIAARQTADDQVEADNLKTANRDLVGAVVGFTTAVDGTPASDMELAKIYQIAIDTNGAAIDGQGIIALTKTKQALGEDEPTNPVGELQILDLIYNDKITTLAELQAVAKDKGVGPKAQLRLLPKMNTATKEIERGVASIARQHSQIVPGTLNPSKKKAQAYASFTAKVDARFIEKMSAWETSADEPDITKKPSKVEIAEKLKNDLMSSEYGKIVTRLVNTTDERLDVYGIDFTEYTTIDEINSVRRLYNMSDDDYDYTVKKIKAIQRNIVLRDELVN